MKSPENIQKKVCFNIVCSIRIGTAGSLSDFLLLYLRRDIILKCLKKVTAILLTFLIVMFACVPVLAETYIEYDHFIFSKNLDNTIEIVDYDNSDANMVIPSTILGHNVVSIDKVAFYENYVITSATLPDTLLKIRDSAFYSAKNLTYVNIPVNCITIENMAFQYCDSLKEVNFESRLTQIEKQIFYGCSSLEEIRLPKTVELIDTYAFGACTSLKKIYIPQATTKIAANAFKDSQNVTIYGYRNSYAQTYADEHNIPFVAIEDADKSELESVLNSAEAILADDNSPYTSESLEALRNAVSAGYKVYKNDYASQSEVDKAVEDINIAIQNLIAFFSDYFYGDSNLNGYVDIDDATDIQRYLAGLLDFSAIQYVVADVNGDGHVSIDDVTEMQLYLADYEVEFVGQKIPTDKFLDKTLS